MEKMKYVNDEKKTLKCVLCGGLVCKYFLLQTCLNGIKACVCEPCIKSIMAAVRNPYGATPCGRDTCSN